LINDHFLSSGTAKDLAIIWCNCTNVECQRLVHNCEIPLRSPSFTKRPVTNLKASDSSNQHHMWFDSHLRPESNFHFQGPGYFKLGALLEGLRQLMSCKLALHVLVTFTEQVVSVQKPITLL